MVHQVKLTNQSLFKCFQIDLRQYFTMRAKLCYHLRLQPSEWQDEPFYEYQYYIKDLIEIIKEKNGEQNDDKYNIDERYNQMKSDSSKYMKNASNMKMPSMSNIKMPKL